MRAGDDGDGGAVPGDAVPGGVDGAGGNDRHSINTFDISIILWIIIIFNI